ncbi:MAG: 1-(5-phosphoribosyl)-5-[(5-phosphoribosylamino)methylideneamino]imidazole-4-carboxamide isomerase [Anaerolineales bacterium]|nr:1-(5-phosphoribosyl)-5-[(5-phosphoribosylamino)methylideneamino]imidazole-4-carboxamide isomerase [Anaerolineales bacterium]MBX3036939.1 1-(5-phosphoribosyl)-5-[(5-phosphoribosylamino)methylideneamino]imidazole-4-carboxamide isomerase [Anaerolineales bacterium]
MSFTIYPAIDLRNGKVVRLKEGDLNRMTSYSDEPIQTAKQWLNAGATWLHVVNLDGAFGESDSTNQLALENILKIGAHVQFGGGLRSMNMIEKIFGMGVSRAVLGTIAIEQPELVKDAIQKFGAEKIAVGIDARDGFVSVHGWKDDSKILATDLALQMQTLGVDTVIFTDILRDGLGSGLNISATKELMQFSRLNVIASGGVHTIDDVIAARDAKLSGAIIGRALYEGTIELADCLRQIG